MKKQSALAAFMIPMALWAQNTVTVQASIKGFSAGANPCREESPNVLTTYNLFRDKNFTIIGISFDSERDNWLAAIRKYGLFWNQLSDLKGWENAVGKEYAIESIPANFLIDPSGKIIAKDLHGDDLENKLAELLK